MGTHTPAVDSSMNKSKLITRRCAWASQSIFPSAEISSVLSFTQISQSQAPNPHEKMRDLAVASVRHAIHVAEKPRSVKARSEHFWHMLRRKPHLNKASWAKRSFSQAFSRSTTQKGAVGAFPSESLSHLLRRAPEATSTAHHHR